METTNPITLTRSQLYEQVWSTPLLRLAKTLNLSDVGLAKLCKKCLIPIPPRGYWAKKRNGKIVRQTPLPPCEDPGLQSIWFSTEKPKTDQTTNQGPEPEYDPDVMAALEKLRSISPLELKTELRNPHRLVRSTKSSLKKAWPNEYGLLNPDTIDNEPALNVYISKESIQRTMVYLDAFIRTIEKIGGAVNIEIKEWSTETNVWIIGEKIMQIRVRERYKQHVKPTEVNRSFFRQRFDYTPSGLLVFEGNRKWGWSILCHDTKRVRLEEKIVPLITEWITEIGKGRIAHRIAQEKQKIQAELDRIRIENERERQKRIADLEQRQKQEQAKIQSLFQDADSWHKSKILRDFIRATETRAIEAHGRIDLGSELSNWLEWAKQQADRLDPLYENPHSVLDEQIT